MNAGPSFLDTNILLYAYDPDDPRKRSIAQELVLEAPHEVLISPQVLGEFSSVLLHKKQPHAMPAEVLETLIELRPIRLVMPDADLVARAVEAHERYGIHFYDGLIVAAAERGKCRRILSEDLAHGQEYFGVRVENPFLLPA